MTNGTNLFRVSSSSYSDLNYVAVTGKLAETLVYLDDFYGEAQSIMQTDSQEYGFEEFLKRYEVLLPDNDGPGYILDKSAEYWTGLTCMRVIRDRETGRHYGLRYRQGMGKHDEEITPSKNSEVLGSEGVGDDLDESWYIFRRVEPFTLTGYGFLAW